MQMSHADARFLKRCTRVLNDRTAFDESERQRTVCWHAAIKVASDFVCAYRACPAARCRRHRRCAGPLFRCEGGARERGPEADTGRLIKSLYQQMLQRQADNQPCYGDEG